MNNIDILKPQCRLDDLWVRVITKNDVDLPLPLSRLELYVTALITGNIDNLPYPQSRVEMLLYCILTDTEYTFNAQSRVEMFLKAILTLDIEGLPTPQSRLEWYLDYIIRNGCLEKYEYYPFNILSYLNVKNTPKAKMKFKSMKGNTLVNVVKVSPSSLIELIYPLTKGKIYTWILEFDSNMDCYCMLEESTSWAKLSDTYSVKAGHNFLIIKGLSIPYNYVGTYNISLTNRVNGEYSPDVKFTNRKVTAVEGDWTNCLSSHIEGMKSFGESENKIEVLSVGKNLNSSEFEIGGIDWTTGANKNVETDRIRSKDFIRVKPNTRFAPMQSKATHVFEYDSDFKFITFNNQLHNYTSSPKCKYVRFLDARTTDISQNLQLEVGTQSTGYKPYQGLSKAIPMYRNTNGELVPVPVLRGKCDGDRFLWGDEILLHDDGKLYYHKRCEVERLTENIRWRIRDDVNFEGLTTFINNDYMIGKYITNSEVMCDKFNSIPGYGKYEGIRLVDTRGYGESITISNNKLKTVDPEGFSLWLQDNNVTFIYKLVEEEVYPCELSEQLYSYDGETNIFINGGAVVGETVIEVGTKLGPIVAEIKQETLRNARAVEGLLAHGVQEMAYQLYPEDFNKSIETIPTESVE
ncbi:hypothetical protein [Romboutsia lituseburensis]|uniref:hypothetical protein n=1 Tax=Romboutsia lituseburensis TaxID=1537 RepID=UPI0022EB8464|nr:hypothetical protein [Romboutsia lituseburensis]